MTGGGRRAFVVAMLLLVGCSGESDLGEETSEPTGECGDGHIDPGEECDEGDDNDDFGTCNLMCRRTSCGDGVVATREGCDDGNRVDDDACPNDCAVCGDGILTPDSSEDCDDGNLVEGDGCGRDCLRSGAVRRKITVASEGRREISDLAFDSSRQLWVRARSGIKLSAFDATGTLVHEIVDAEFGEGTIVLHDLTATADGNVAVVGSRTSTTDVTERVLWVFGSDGSLLLEQLVVLTDATAVDSLQASARQDGGLIIGGTAERLDGSGVGAFVLVLDPSGDTLWEDVFFVVSEWLTPKPVTRAVVGGPAQIVASGIHYEDGSDTVIGFIRAYDLGGTLAWQLRDYPRTTSARHLAMADGELWAAGGKSGEGAWVARLDAESGEVLSERTGSYGEARGDSTDAGPIATHQGAAFVCSHSLEEAIGWNIIHATFERYATWGHSEARAVCDGVAAHEEVGVAVAYNQVDHNALDYTAFILVYAP